MKIDAVVKLLFLLASGASAGIAPELSLSVDSSSSAGTGLSAIEPTLKWSAVTSAGEYELESGVDVTVQDFSFNLPCTVWGKIKKSIFGGKCDVSACAELQVQNADTVDFDLRLESDDTNLQVLASAAPRRAFVSQVEWEQKIPTPSSLGALIVNPRYDLEAKKGELTCSLDVQGTNIAWDADKATQKITLSRKLGKSLTLTPSLTHKGIFQLKAKYALPESGTVTATLKPNNSIKVEWKDGPWTAEFNTPMDGYFSLKEGVAVKVKRTVDVL